MDDGTSHLLRPQATGEFFLFFGRVVNAAFGHTDVREEMTYYQGPYPLASALRVLFDLESEFIPFRALSWNASSSHLKPWKWKKSPCLQSQFLFTNCIYIKLIANGAENTAFPVTSTWFLRVCTPRRPWFDNCNSVNVAAMGDEKVEDSSSVIVPGVGGSRREQWHYGQRMKFSDDDWIKKLTFFLASPISIHILSSLPTLCCCFIYILLCHSRFNAKHWSSSFFHISLNNNDINYHFPSNLKGYHSHVYMRQTFHTALLLSKSNTTPNYTILLYVQCY